MRRSSRFRVLIATLLAGGVLAACNGGLPARNWPVLPPQGDEVDVTELRSLSHCGSTSAKPAVTLLADAAAVAAWLSPRGVDLGEGAPLPEGPFVVIEHGARSSAGYGLAVSRRARLFEGRLSLTVSFLGPKTGPAEAGDAAAPSSPCVLVALPPATYRRIEVSDPAGRRRAAVSAPAN